jgi:hypothetical protein
MVAPVFDAADRKRSVGYLLVSGGAGGGIQ